VEKEKRIEGFSLNRDERFLFFIKDGKPLYLIVVKTALAEIFYFSP